jgi:hypothetical protein
MVKGKNALPNYKKILGLFEEIAKDKSAFSAILIFAIIYLICICLFFLPIYGHTSPIAYKPQPNQIVNTSQAFPSEVTITFTETRI